jgi:hypothetical protein
MKPCKHNCGWYISNAQLMVFEDELTILPMPNVSKQRDKTVAICNCGCGATRNVYLTSVDFKLGKVRPSRDSEAI